MTNIVPVHEQIRQHRHRETLDLVEAEVHQAGTDGIRLPHLKNRLAHYHGLEPAETDGLVEELVEAGRLEPVQGLLRSTANGWTCRSHCLRSLRSANSMTLDELIESNPRGSGRQVHRKTLAELEEEGLAFRAPSPRGEPDAWMAPQDTTAVPTAVLAQAMGRHPSVPAGALLEAVREMSQGYAVISSVPETDSLADALGCRPAGPAIMLAVARDRRARAQGHDILLRETQAAIEGCGLSAQDDHPAQVINQLAARLRSISDLAAMGTVDGGDA